MEERKKNIRIVMFPWLARGHISAFLELAKALAKRNFITYLFTTHANLAYFKQTLSREETRHVKLMDIILPYLPQLPRTLHTTAGLPPHLINTLKKIFLKGKPDFFTILDTLKPDLIIYDFLLPCIPLMASTLHFPAVLFLTSGAAANSYHYHLRDNNPSIEYPFPEIFFQDHEHKKNKKVFDSLENDGIDEKNGITRCFERSKGIILIKTFKELEGKYIDYLTFLFNKRFVPVGPLVRAFDQTDGGEYNDKIIEWLNEKEKCSTIFICFGSEFYLSKEEIQELALGLELSMVNFIWVIRFPVRDKTEILEVLPEGFYERNWTRGLIVKDWAPQGRILKHSSIAGFVSHCGWNSVMEAVSCGVPIIALPMQHEQPLNARLLVNEVRVGLEIQRNEEGNFSKDEVAKVVREMVLEKRGESVRKKVKELSEKMRENGENDIERVVDELVDLYKNSLRSTYYYRRRY
ncbi:beta-D-glucosyl crocetin beta-1,6-glucosyltransferase-like [Solanum tuberosum]|nr:PREDICTED: beta-D-glucosyl crocetin beta-1,6-glucosyltransferase-like [Solanum tuberosum]